MKKFDDFLDRMQGLLDEAKKHGHIIVRVKDLENAFPELKESKDEKIRKVLIKYVKTEDYGLNTFCGIPTNDVLAWLEKQGQTFTKKDVDDAYLKGITNAKNEIKKQYEATYQIRKDIASFIFNYRGDIKDRAKWMNYLGVKVSFVEKQGEQPQGKSALEAAKDEKVDNQNCVKLTDNVEPEHLLSQKCMYYTCIKDYYSSDNTLLYVKGHIYKYVFDGYINNESHFDLSFANTFAKKYIEPTKDEDWIVCEHDNVISKPMQYKEFKKEVTQKNIKNLEDKGVNPKLRLWTIEDAKDGDVLVVPPIKGSEHSEQIFIFKEIKDRLHVKNAVEYYCRYMDNEFTVNKTGYMGTSSERFCPATKEQRDTLFKAMADAGYEFDFVKKE